MYGFYFRVVLDSLCIVFMYSIVTSGSVPLSSMFLVCVPLFLSYFTTFISYTTLVSIRFYELDLSTTLLYELDLVCLFSMEFISIVLFVTGGFKAF
jgi:hypothetical protein